MKKPTLRNAALVAALAAVTATAYATTEQFSSAYRSADNVAVEEGLKPAEAVPANDAVVEPNETVIATDTALAPPPAEPVAPATQRVAAEPPVVVQEKAMTLDERIQANVQDRIASMQNVSGKVGVTTQDQVVTLTGLVTTGGQAYRIGKVAYSVDGVRRVDNQIRAKIGGSV